MLGDLFEEHRVIRARAEELLAMLHRTPRAPADEITQIRLRIASITMAHLRTEDELIIKPLRTSGRMDEIPGAADLIAKMQQGHRNYSKHVGRWTLQSVEADRAGFTKMVAERLRALEKLTLLEEEQLYRPALALLGQVQLRSAG